MDAQGTPQTIQDTALPTGHTLRKRLLLIILGILACIGVFATGQYAYSAFMSMRQADRVACTADAMICPDGSAVGRVGPACEFAPCPTSQYQNIQEEPTVSPMPTTPQQPTTQPSQPPTPITPSTPPTPTSRPLPAEISEAYSWPVQQVCVQNTSYKVYYQLDDGTNIYTHEGSYVRGKPTNCS